MISEQNIQNRPAVLINGASTRTGSGTTLYLDQKGWMVYATIRKAINK